MSVLPHSGKLAKRRASATPEPPSPQRIGRRLLKSAAAVLVLVGLVLTLPGLGELRAHLAHAAPGWVVGGAALEVLSVLSSSPWDKATPTIASIPRSPGGSKRYSRR